jgi:hypothetical protein
MGKLAFRPEQRKPLEAARDKVWRRLEAIENRNEAPKRKIAVRTCVLLKWPRRLEGSPRS